MSKLGDIAELGGYRPTTWREIDDAALDRAVVPDRGMNLFAATEQEAPRVARDQAEGAKMAANWMLPQSASDVLLMAALGPIGGRAARAGLGAAGLLSSDLPGVGIDEAQALDLKRLIRPRITQPIDAAESYSLLKQRVPLHELEQGRSFIPEGTSALRSRPEDLPLGSTALSLHGDRSWLGNLLALEGTPLAAGHYIPGGRGFIGKNSPEGAVWASEPPIASGYQRRIKTLQDETGQPVYGLYGPMGHRSVDFQPAVGKAALELVERDIGKIPKSALQAFNERMRAFFGRPPDPEGKTAAAKRGRTEWPAWEEWPGIENTEAAAKALAETTGKKRSKFGFMLDKGEMMDAGLPNISTVRHGFTDPAVADIPNYAYGKGVARLSPEPVAGYRHPAFGKNIGGQDVGGWGFASPREVSFMNVVDDLVKQGEPVKSWDFYFGGRMPKSVPYEQPITRKWIDANSAFGEEVAKFGELGAIDKFAREGLRY